MRLLLVFSTMKKILAHWSERRIEPRVRGSKGCDEKGQEASQSPSRTACWLHGIEERVTSYADAMP